jgi:methionyl-tRNA formyltransferase
MKFVFAGDRDISVWVLEYLICKGHYPEILLLTEEGKATHDKELIVLANLSENNIFYGKAFQSLECLDKLRSFQPDYIIGIHFPYLISKEILDIPKYGFINLHPAFLPFNRGWHTPTWGILESTPIGATLHFMSEKLDEGDIIHQRELDINPFDTADSLYKRLKLLEFEVFKEALPTLITKQVKINSQSVSEGTQHKKKDLFENKLRHLNLKEQYFFEDLLHRMRAFTTNYPNEAVFYFINGKKYYLQIKITSESE